MGWSTKHILSHFFVILVVSKCMMSTVNAEQESGSHTPTHSNQTQHHAEGEIRVAAFNFNHVATPFIIVTFLALTTICKLAFHRSKFLRSTVPESVLLIIVGVAVGGFLFAFKVTFILETTVFFQFLLPPIMLESGYFLYNKAFFSNLGTILVFAFIGTLFNAIAIGSSLFGCIVGGATGLSPVNVTYLHSLVFGSLISAVDPVAVIAVFDDVHVNEQLYFLVFGESLLNDAVTVVLYKLMYALSILPVIDAGQIVVGVVSVFVVSLGGIAIGLLFGMATAFLTKYSRHVDILEPTIVLSMAYLSYLSAEIFEWSGIMSIATCGLALKHYAEANLSHTSRVTLKYFIKSLSSGAESIIFLFLGLSLFSVTHEWDAGFILWTLLFCFVFRCIGVVVLTYLANKFRTHKVSAVDQFIMSYGGLRGAVAFSLAVLLNHEKVPAKNLMITTALIVILVTVFVQGSTIKPLVSLLHVRRKEKKDHTVYEQIQIDIFGHVKAGIEEITGYYTDSALKNLWTYYDGKFFKKYLQRNPEYGDFDIVHHYEKIQYQEAAKKLMKRSVRQEEQDQDVELALMAMPSSEVEKPTKELARRISRPYVEVLNRERQSQEDDNIILKRKRSNSLQKFEGRHHYGWTDDRQLIADSQVKARQRWNVALAKQMQEIRSLRESTNLPRQPARDVHTTDV